MPADIGRISGIMLKDNLTRDGVDLAFETDLIYLDVNTNKVGIKKSNPDVDLDINGTHRTTNLVSTSVTNGNTTFDLSRITTTLGSLNITAADRVFASAIETAGLNINNNDISTVVSNDNIELRPNGTGQLRIYNDFNVTGNLHSTGDITLDGNIQFGNNSDDNIDFNADINSDIIPDQDNFYKLGSSSTKRWNSLYTNLVNGDAITTSSLQTPSGVNYALRPGNIWFVATNGDNENQGNHENGPFATVEKALSVATAGDSVFIYPGTYYELFPLVVPVGVTVRGFDLRSVIIVPDTASQSEDVFHLNGETTVSNLTIKDFYYDSINDTGYAFRFAPGMTVTTRSPYVQNVSVITHGTTTTVDDPRGFASGDAGKGALVDGSAANYLTNEASMLFHSVTFITPGVDALTMTNGVRIEWLNSFTYFADRAMYLTNGTAGQGNQATAQLTVNGISEQTITIGDTVTVNLVGGGTRILEIIGVTYSGSDALIEVRGDFGNIQTYATAPSGISTTYTGVDQVFSWSTSGPGPINQLGGQYADDNEFNDAIWNDLVPVGATVIVKWYYHPVPVNMGVVTQVDKAFASFLDHFVTVTNPSGFILPNYTSDNLTNHITEYFTIEYPTIVFSEGQTGLYISDVTPLTGIFGGEVRSIGSANVYGNYGAVADGADTLMYLIQHNFAYIGAGKDVSNDKTLVIQTNETVETNSGKIYYQSQDHTGTFRVGDIFYVDFEQGTVSFDASGLSSTGATGLTVTTGSAVTVINKDFITTGNLKIAGNTIESLTGDVNLLAASTTTNLTLNVNVAKNLDITGDFGLEGQLTLGNQSVDTVTFAQSLNQNFEPDITETYNLGSATKVWRDIYTSEANINDIRIRGNVIETTVSNSDLELRANSAGIVNIKDSAKFDQTLTVNGLTTTQSVNFIGTLNHLGAVVLLGDKTVDGYMSVTGTFTVGSNAYFDNINIVNNKLFTTDSNSNLEISAAGTGIITVPTKNVSLGQSLTVTGDISTTNVNTTNRVTAEEFYNNDILIKDNYITTTVGNNNLELRGNSGGGVFLETTKFTSNVISSVDDIIIQPSTGKNLKFNTTAAVVLPKGTTIDRPTFQQGDIRFNTGTAIFEGFGAAFGGVYSLDRQTSVIAGSTENLNFTANNILTMDITTARVRMNGLLVDNTLFDNNSVITTNNDLTFAPNGTGLNRIENLTFDAENIQNDLNSVITVAGTGIGYVKLQGTTAFVIPYGDNSERPPSPEIGATRYNVEEGYIEVYDGVTWNNSAGVGDTVTAQYMEDTSYLWNLILG